jgi:PAS domain S-box-containing protein
MKLSKALRFTLLFAAIGILTTLLVIYVQREVMATYARNLSLIKLGDYVRNQATQSRLSFEEASEGNKGPTAYDVPVNSLRAAVNLLQDAYNGYVNVIGDFDFPKSEETLVVLKQAIVSGENVRSSLKQIASAGLSEDELERYNKSYSTFQDALDALIIHVDVRVKEDQSRLTTLRWLAVGLVFVSFTLLCWLIYRLQHANDLSVESNTRKLEEETTRVSKVSGFIEAVSAGNYDIEMESGDENDSLINTLVSMKNKLKQTSEDDRKRNWSTTGEAQIGEILRANTSSSSELYDNIIKFLVKYTKSNQGGLFIYNDEPEAQYLELVACYAFERKKFLTKKIEPGDGLVGQCFLEGERMYLQEVPEEYVTITSGLGGSNPSAVLLVPMKVNDNTYGVIELASFHTYEEYQIQLIEKLAESIASTISNVRVNETTRILLEKTQQQAEEMKSQEEEIRQNMEELEATQEEMRRKQSILEVELSESQRQAELLKLQESRLAESQETLQAIVDNIPRAIFWKDRELRFMGCNKIFAAIAGAESINQIVGKTDFDMAWSAQAEAYRKDDLEVMRTRKGKLDIEEVNVNSDGQESWVRTSKVPIITAQGDVVAILGMFEDITHFKRREAEVAQKLQERETALQEIQQLKRLLETKNS